VRPIDRVLERLKGVKAHNGYFEAPCPAHEDREPSLSISEGSDGRVLVKCFAGCDFEEIVSAIDLKAKDLFSDEDKRIGGRSYPSRNRSTVQHPPKKPHGDEENTVAGGNTTPDNSATPTQHPDTPHLRLVASEGERVEGCTLNAYSEYVGLPVDYLRGLGLREIHYIDDKAVKMPYLDADGSEEVCVRFRVSLTGKPKVKTRKGDKHQLYGLWRLEEARQAGYVILVEGESDRQSSPPN
jgi:hypothetical protein